MTRLKLLPSVTESISLRTSDRPKSIKASTVKWIHQASSSNCSRPLTACRIRIAITTIAAIRHKFQQTRSRALLARRLNLLALTIASIKMNRLSLWIRTRPQLPIGASKTQETSNKSSKASHNITISRQPQISIGPRATATAILNNSEISSHTRYRSRRRHLCSRPVHSLSVWRAHRLSLESSPRFLYKRLSWGKNRWFQRLYTQPRPKSSKTATLEVETEVMSKHNACRLTLVIKIGRHKTRPSRSTVQPVAAAIWWNPSLLLLPPSLKTRKAISNSSYKYPVLVVLEKPPKQSPPLTKISIHQRV